MAQSVFKTVIARYKTILGNQKEWIKPSFKSYSTTLSEQGLFPYTKLFFREYAEYVKLPYFAIDGMSKYFGPQ